MIYGQGIVHPDAADNVKANCRMSHLPIDHDTRNFDRLILVSRKLLEFFFEQVRLDSWGGVSVL
jgi:hypothetical protein